VQVEIWSDVVCPWCAVGKARFEAALAQYEHADEVDVRWRSFELDPNAPASRDVDYVTMLATKYRTSRDQAQAMIDRMTQAGADDGIEFRFDIARPGNTFDAHRVLHLAADHGRQHETKQRFLAGYHSEGVPIADHGAITALAVDAGLVEDEIADVLATDRYADAVRADEGQAHEYGISGVPFFVFEQRVGVSGAQPTEHLLQGLRQAHTLPGEDADAATSEAATSDHDDHAHHDHDPDEACVDGVCAI